VYRQELVRQARESARAREREREKERKREKKKERERPAAIALLVREALEMHDEEARDRPQGQSLLGSHVLFAFTAVPCVLLRQDLGRREVL
jgi:hypothetical protein